MPYSEKVLKETHRRARDLVDGLLPFGTEPLMSNNENRQVLIFFEIFRRTAYAVIRDGGPDTAIEFMEWVIHEMRAVKKQARNDNFDSAKFAHQWDRRRELSNWPDFTESHFVDEVTEEDYEEEERRFELTQKASKTAQ